MSRKQNQQYDLRLSIDTEKKTGKQTTIMHGAKVLTANELVEFVRKNFDKNEDCCILLHCEVMNEETKVRRQM